MRSFLARRAGERREALAARREELEAAIPALVEILRRFGATRVWLFGSLVDGTIDERSDIDLAVVGLDPERYFDALGSLLMAAPASVDLVDLTSAPEGLARHVRTTGRLVS